MSDFFGGLELLRAPLTASPRCAVSEYGSLGSLCSGLLATLQTPKKRLTLGFPGCASALRAGRPEPPRKRPFAGLFACTSRLDDPNHQLSLRIWRCWLFEAGSARSPS